MVSLSLFPGKIGTLILLFTLCIIILYFSFKKEADRSMLRRLPQLDAVDEAVGRCTEMGKPIHFSAGMGSLYSDLAPQTIAGFSILRSLIKSSIDRGAKLIVTTETADNVPLLNDLLRVSYTSQNALDQLNEDTLRFFGGMYPHIAGTISIFEHEKCGATILTGAYTSFTVEVLETASRMGMISILGSAREGCFNIMAFADYTLLGEELYAAGAYLSNEAPQIGSIIGQDGAKLIVIALLIGSILLYIAGVDVISILKI
jgi:hypothetical protein